MRKSIYISVFAFFLLIAVISSVMIYDYYEKADTQEELYESLAEIVEQNTESSEIEPTEPSENTEPVILPEYAELLEQNGDIVGWITIPDTKINYPIMSDFVYAKMCIVINPVNFTPIKRRKNGTDLPMTRDLGYVRIYMPKSMFKGLNCNFLAFQSLISYYP